MATLPITLSTASLHDYAAPFRIGKETRPLCQRVWHAVQAFFRFIVYMMYRVCRIVFDCYQPENPAFIKPTYSKDGLATYNLENLPWNKQEGASDGLFFFVHGYGGRPQRWSDYLLDAQRKAPGAHHLVPHVPHRGNCPLETSGKPLLEVVQNYVNKHPGKPLYLFGFSNGTRLVTYIEAHLQLPPGSSLNVVSIAGIHSGSRVVTNMQRVARAAGMHSELITQLSYHSVTSQELLALRETTADARRDIQARHIFFASTEDEAIQPVSTALPGIAKALHRIVHGHAHGSIMAAVRSTVWEDLDL